MSFISCFTNLTLGPEPKTERLKQFSTLYEADCGLSGLLAVCMKEHHYYMNLLLIGVNGKAKYLLVL